MTPEFIEVGVPNWEKYNPRSDRKNHSWFRFQNDFFSDQKLWGLDDTKRLLLVFLFCEISKRHGEPTKINIQYVADNRKQTPEKIIEDIRALAKLGVIETPTGVRTPSKRHTTNERTDERTDVADKPPLPRLALLWNEYSKKLRKVREVSSGRQKRINARLEECSDYDQWREAIQKIADSDFCNGRIPGKTWKASFDFLLRPDTRVKALEGAYDNEDQAQGASGDICGVASV